MACALRHVSWLSGGVDNKELGIQSSADLQVSSVHTSRTENPSGSSHVSGTSDGRKRQRKETLDLGEREPFQHQGSLPVPYPNFEERAKPVNRKQTRILMKTRGWGLKNFKDLEELLWVFHDAIDDHKQFYYGGVLHRDISFGNIVILNPLKDGKTGRLIDLDHAKMNKPVGEKRKLFKYNTIGDSIRSKANVIRAELAEENSVTKRKPIFVDESTAIAALEACGTRVWTAITYLETLVERLKLQSSERQRIKLSDLHWDLPVEDPPSFENYSAGDGVHIGTLPYMSHQILGEIPPVHDAIHDIESFFWVMVYIALTRAGPGTKNNHPPQTLLDSYFNTNNPEALASVKGRIFSTRDKIADAYMERLSAQFHSYFKGLKPLITKWQKVIQTAYQFEAFELNAIHEYTSAIIKEAIAGLGVNPSPELTQKEEDRRQAYNRDTQNAVQANISVPTTQQVTPERAPRQTTNAQPEEPESPTRNPKAKKLRSGEL